MEIHLPGRAVLLDCDGVLVDSTEAAERAWIRWAGEYGLDPAAVLDGLHGRRSADTVARHLPPPLRAEGARRIDEIEVATAAGVPAVPGALALVESLVAGAAVWAVVTSAPPALLRARLAAASLPQPPVTVTGADVAAGKPAPDCYRRAADLLAVPVRECIVVEDSPAGIAAARSAPAGAVLGVGDRAPGADVDAAVPDLLGVTWDGSGLRVPAAQVSGRVAPM